jgi:hypothetical protein
VLAGFGAGSERACRDCAGRHRERGRRRHAPAALRSIRSRRMFLPCSGAE